MKDIARKISVALLYDVRRHFWMNRLAYTYSDAKELPACFPKWLYHFMLILCQQCTRATVSAHPCLHINATYTDNLESAKWWVPAHYLTNSLQIWRFHHLVLYRQASIHAQNAVLHLVAKVRLTDLLVSWNYEKETITLSI